MLKFKSPIHRILALSIGVNLKLTSLIHNALEGKTRFEFDCNDELSKQKQKGPFEKNVEEVAGEGSLATIFGAADEGDWRGRSDGVIGYGVGGVGPFVGYDNIRRRNLIFRS